MPVGSDSNHEDVSVQAILEGLGLISSLGKESPQSASFNTTHNIWPVPEASESTPPSQSTDDTLPRLVQENAPTCLQPQCRILREELVPPTITVPVARREEYHGATAPNIVNHRFIKGCMTTLRTCSWKARQCHHQVPMISATLISLVEWTEKNDHV
jgi:hypothetical protein